MQEWSSGAHFFLHSLRLRKRVQQLSIFFCLLLIKKMSLVEPVCKCLNTCGVANESSLTLDLYKFINNSICEDGGVNTNFSYCPLGTDCGDCGERCTLKSLKCKRWCHKKRNTLTWKKKCNRRKCKGCSECSQKPPPSPPAPEKPLKCRASCDKLSPDKMCTKKKCGECPACLSLLMPGLPPHHAGFCRKWCSLTHHQTNAPKRDARVVMNVWKAILFSLHFLLH